MLASYNIFLSLLLATASIEAQQTSRPPPRDPRDLPIVDLGYTRQRADSFKVCVQLIMSLFKHC